MKKILCASHNRIHTFLSQPIEQEDDESSESEDHDYYEPDFTTTTFLGMYMELAKLSDIPDLEYYAEITQQDLNSGKRSKHELVISQQDRQKLLHPSEKN